MGLTPRGAHRRLRVRVRRPNSSGVFGLDGRPTARAGGDHRRRRRAVRCAAEAQRTSRAQPDRLDRRDHRNGARDGAAGRRVPDKFGSGDPAHSCGNRPGEPTAWVTTIWLEPIGPVFPTRALVLRGRSPGEAPQEPSRRRGGIRWAPSGPGGAGTSGWEDRDIPLVEPVLRDRAVKPAPRTAASCRGAGGGPWSARPCAPAWWPRPCRARRCRRRRSGPPGSRARR
jgi:hypothetical protein